MATLAEQPVDLVVRVVAPSDLPQPQWQPVRPWAWRAPTPRGSWLRLRYTADDAFADFVVDPPGTRVWVCPSNAVWADVSELLLGPVFSCVLAHRGVTCLHAGVVEIDGRVAGFLGDKGDGKSTLALALVATGARVVSDDVAALDLADRRATVRIGPARLRIHRDSAEAVGSWLFDRMPRVFESELDLAGKRYLNLAQPPADGTRALNVLYFLGPRDPRSDRPVISPVPAAAAVPRLMAHRHMAEVLDRDAEVRSFPEVAQLTDRVAIRSIDRPDDLAAMGATVAAIRADLAAIDTADMARTGG